MPVARIIGSEELLNRSAVPDCCDDVLPTVLPLLANPWPTAGSRNSEDSAANRPQSKRGPRFLLGDNCVVSDPMESAPWDEAFELQPLKALLVDPGNAVEVS
mmetsp:Transcript_69819/g.195711  ORF Transcript_69819/g.195711 Transcript_69819/m.195711 type:complete len:102 (-) Transcript_69819:1316-1621(-)